MRKYEVKLVKEGSGWTLGPFVSSSHTSQPDWLPPCIISRTELCSEKQGFAPTGPPTAIMDWYLFYSNNMKIGEWRANLVLKKINTRQNWENTFVIETQLGEVQEDLLLNRAKILFFCSVLGPPCSLPPEGLKWVFCLWFWCPNGQDGSGAPHIGGKIDWANGLDPAEKAGRPARKI